MKSATLFRRSSHSFHPTTTRVPSSSSFTSSCQRKYFLSFVSNKVTAATAFTSSSCISSVRLQEFNDDVMSPQRRCFSTTSSNRNISLDQPTEDVGRITPVPWEGIEKKKQEEQSGAFLPSATETSTWAALGEAIVKYTQQFDSGPEAFRETIEARRQLETVVRGCGYDITVCIFGGLTVLGMLEAGGDIDFVGVADCEPTIYEASEIVVRLSREMRRIGLRAFSIPRARVPVVKVDRVSFALPGTPLHSNARYAVFQCTRSLTQEEKHAFAERMKADWGAESVQWGSNNQHVTVCFSDTATLMEAIVAVKKHGGIDIPLRVPSDPRNGPELYRYPFDLCLTSTGLRNSYLLREYLGYYPYARHLLLALKKWGRSAGVLNSIDGLLPSYGMTVMLLHYLVKVGVIPPIDPNKINHEPLLLPKEPEYIPLAGIPSSKVVREEGDQKKSSPGSQPPPSASMEMATLGYLYAHFFSYFGDHFDATKEVICTTLSSPLEKKTLKWQVEEDGDVSGQNSRPPYFHFCIKDPYGTENIARNLNRGACWYMKEAHQMALRQIIADCQDPGFLVNSLCTAAPNPSMAVVENPGLLFTSQPGQQNGRGGEGEGDGSKKVFSSAAASESNEDKPTSDQKEEEGAGTIARSSKMTDGEKSSEARRLLAKAEFHRRKDDMQRFGQTSVQRNVQTRAAQDMTRSLVNWIKSGSKKKEGE